MTCCVYSIFRNCCAHEFPGYRSRTSDQLMPATMSSTVNRSTNWANPGWLEKTFLALSSLTQCVICITCFCLCQFRFQWKKRWREPGWEVIQTGVGAALWYRCIGGGRILGGHHAQFQQFTILQRKTAWILIQGRWVYRTASKNKFTARRKKTRYQVQIFSNKL